MNRATTAKVLAGGAALLGVVAIVTRPFLFAPIGLLLLLVSARTSGDRRLTWPAALVLAVGALAGAAVAAGFTKPLY